MGYAPRTITKAGVHPPGRTITPYEAPGIIGQAKLIARVAGATAVYPTANRAWFIPVEVERPTPIRSLWWHNGTTVSGNIDVGAYVGTTRLTSTGAVAQAGVSTLQEIDVADAMWYPDEPNYLAVSMNNVTGHLFRYTTSYLLGLVMDPPIRFMDSAHPLPATAVFAEPATSYWPVIGASMLASGL